MFFFFKKKKWKELFTIKDKYPTYKMTQLLIIGEPGGPQPPLAPMVHPLLNAHVIN